jgi:hypothetical protein
MTEAKDTLQQAQLRTTLATAARIRALQVATGHIKCRLQAQGLRVSQFSRRELVVHAEQYLSDHPRRTPRRGQGRCSSLGCGRRVRKAHSACST